MAGCKTRHVRTPSRSRIRNLTRQIITAKDLAPSVPGRGGRIAGGTAAAPPKPDSYTDRLLKYIPVEVVAVYLAADAALRQVSDLSSRSVANWVVFAVLLLGTAAYLS